MEIALQTWPEKTQQEIADQVGCSQGLVSRVKDDIITSNNVSFPERRKDSLGRMQPTTYARHEPEQIVDTPEFIEPDEEQEKEESPPPKHGRP